jgi:very-short-patch-repair endonuclease
MRAAATYQMRDDIPSSAISRACAMRLTPTDAERVLWGVLRCRRMQAVKFRRQAPIGPYVVDFLCVEHRLVVECDGPQHAYDRRDAARDAWLERQGYKIIRFWKAVVLREPASVLDTVAAACGLPW